MTARVAFVLIFVAVVVAQDSGKFFFLSDWHLDPYYNPNLTPDTYCQNQTEIIFNSTIPESYYQLRDNPWERQENNTILPNFNYGQYGCDAPISLAQEALRAMVQVLPNPDFFIYSGDMSGHHLPTPESRFTAINDTISLIATAYPDSPIYPTLGNNDCYPDYYLNYRPRHANDWLTKIWSSWSVYSGIPADQEENFTHGGYYVVQHSANLSVISLNTIYVCGGHNPDWDADTFTDPAGQFAWLNETLLSIENSGGSAYILGHFPPSTYWHHDYTYSYNYIVKRFQNIIIGQFFGHTHRDELHLISNTEFGESFGFWLQTPSLTPKDSNNPSFRVVSYDTKNYKMTDYTQYITGLTQIQRRGTITWYKEYEFASLYGTPSGYIDTSAIQNAILSIFEDPLLFSTWKANYNTQYENPDDKLDYYCKMVYPQLNDQDICDERSIYQPSPLERGIDIME